MSIIKRKAGSEDIVKSVLEFDEVPTEGSPNLVDSGAVAKFTDAVPEGTSPENPLVNESALAEFELAMLTNIPCANNTLRFSFSKKDYDPTVAGVGTNGTWTKLATTQANVWDWTRNGASFNTSFGYAFTDSDNLVKVIAVGDLSGVTDFEYMFRSCSSIVSVVDMGTSSATSIARMFFECTGLKKLPKLSTGSVTSVLNCFYGCVNVESGALAMYEQMSTQVTPPETTSGCFTNCGKNTTTGAAELAQIPQSWGGTMPEP